MHANVDGELPRHAAPSPAMLSVVRGSDTWRKPRGSPSIRWGVTRTHVIVVPPSQ